MVDKNALRAAFSSRLHEALDDAGVRHRGRGVDIHRQLKSLGVDKTTQAVSKWLNGEAMAEADSMEALCCWLNIRREWLEYGVLPKDAKSQYKPQELIGLKGIASNLTESNFCKVPLLTWAQAATAHTATAKIDYSDIELLLCCPIPISSKGYALRVHNDSMTNLNSGKSYPIECIIFVDPQVKTKVTDRVIALLPHTHEVTFKVLSADAGRTFLKSINPQYPILEIFNDTQICGKVVGTFIPE